MSDLESYVAHCYDLLLQRESEQNKVDQEECLACARLIEREDKAAVEEPSNHRR